MQTVLVIAEILTVLKWYFRREVVRYCNWLLDHQLDNVLDELSEALLTKIKAEREAMKPVKKSRAKT